MLVKIFSQTDKNFTSNGDIICSPLKAKVTKQDNGDYYLNIECGLEYIDYFVTGNIIVAPTPTGEQAFRISNPEKTKTKLSCKAYHVFYDSENYAIADSYVVEKNCNDALAHLNAATDQTSPFSTFSNVTTVDSFRCVRKSLYEAVQTVLERWGGHLVRNNFSIQILSSIGQDNGVTVRYKKNLKDITCAEDWSEVVTKILPVGRDGTLLNALDSSQSIYLSGETQYAIPYTKVIQFDQDIDEQDYPSQAAYITALVNDLRAQATAYLEANCVPKINYTLKANLEKITDVGDTVEVIDERLGINLTTHVIGFTYDCISGQYTEVEFGNFQKTLSNLMSTVTATSENIAKQISQENTDVIWSAMLNSYVYFDGHQILVFDALPKESATNVIKIDAEGFKSSTTGINGAFYTWRSIDGILSLGGLADRLGTLKLYDDNNVLIAQMGSDGLKLLSNLIINNEEMKDFIVGQGTTSGWEWIKYASGACELWSKQTVASSSVTWTGIMTAMIDASTSQALLQTGEKAITYPFNVTDAIINATIDTCGSDIGWIAQAKATANTGATLTIVREGSTGSMTINVHVKGAWR